MDDERNESTRRKLMAAVGGALGVGFLAGNASADDGSASGQIGTSAEPAKHVYTEQVVFHERTSDPSSPADGTNWYRGDL